MNYFVSRFSLALALTSPLVCFAQTAWWHDLEWSVAAGPNALQTRDTTLTISPYQTDAVQVNHVANNPTWKVGIGYPILKNVSQDAFFNQVLVELNLYHSQGTITGDVWQYQSAEFNNYSFRAPVSSTRLMLDIKPDVVTWQNIATYAIVGLGSSWNRMSYQESINNPDVPDNSNLSLGDKTTINLAYECGWGLRAELTQHLSGTLEYLYSDLGNISPSSVSNNGVSLASPPSFAVHNQSVLLGLVWKL